MWKSIELVKYEIIFRALENDRKVIFDTFEPFLAILLWSIHSYPFWAHIKNKTFFC